MDPNAVARYREELFRRNPELLKQIEALRAKNAGGSAPQYGNDTARQVFQTPGQTPALSSVKPFELKPGGAPDPGFNLRLASDGNRIDGPEFHMPPESGVMNLGKGVFDQLAPKRGPDRAAALPNGVVPQAPADRPVQAMKPPFVAGGAPGRMGGGSGVGSAAGTGAVGDALSMVRGVGREFANVPGYLSGLVPSTLLQGPGMSAPRSPVAQPQRSPAQAPLNPNDPSNFATYGSSISPRDREQLMAGFQPKGPDFMEQLGNAAQSATSLDTGMNDTSTSLEANQQFRDSQQWAEYVDMAKRLALWKKLGRRPTPEEEQRGIDGVGLPFDPKNIRF